MTVPDTVPSRAIFSFFFNSNQEFWPIKGSFDSFHMKLLLQLSVDLLLLPRVITKEDK